MVLILNTNVMWKRRKEEVDPSWLSLAEFQLPISTKDPRTRRYVIEVQQRIARINSRRFHIPEYTGYVQVWYCTQLEFKGWYRTHIVRTFDRTTYDKSVDAAKNSLWGKWRFGTRNFLGHFSNLFV